MAWTLVGVRRDAQAADRDLQRLRSELDVHAMLEGDGVDELRASARRFDQIDARLGNPLLAPLRVAPVVGRQMSAASHQAHAATKGLRAAADVSEKLRGLVDRSMRSGPDRVAALREVERVAADGRPAFEALDLGPGRALVGQLASARARIEEARADAVQTLTRAAAVSAGLADFFEGPADYLLLAANNAQMQNGQGMFLSAGVLHVADGRMDLDTMEPTADFPVASPRIPLDPDLAARWGWLDPNDDFRHLGLSHRFPVTAPLAAARWSAAGRGSVAGVLVVDPMLLQVIMEASGPVTTSDGELDAKAIVRFALHDQYQGYLTSTGDGSFSEQRRDQLGEIAVEALRNFEAVDSVDSRFFQRFADVARGRHLFGWSTDPAVQKGWVAAGIDGQMSRDSALLSFVNRSGNKLDWFLRSTADLRVSSTEDGDDVELRITLRNDAPATGEPAYVVGPYPNSGLAPGEYLGLVTLNLPEAARDARFDGVDELAVAGGDGRNRVVAAWVHVRRGEQVELVARFRLPAGSPPLRIEASARATPTAWSYGSDKWDDAQAHSVALPGP